MSDPRNTLGTVLIAAAAGLLASLAGGTGGCLLALRNERRRIDALDDDVNSLRARMQKREGAAGRQVAQANGSRLDAQVERILAAQEEGAPPRRRAAVVDPEIANLPEWARAALTGDAAALWKAGRRE